MSKSLRLALLVAVLALLVTACAAGVNANVDVASADGEIAGFWIGLWHGIITPVTFVISLFTENVNIYEIHNSGGWYDFGFVLGAGAFLGGSGRGIRRRRR